MSMDFLQKRGGYRSLKVYAITERICDLTVVFIEKYIPVKSRTRDQMEQAGRSGKQNIAEGSKAAMTSTETEIKLTNVAKASLEELKLDYEDYLRQHGLDLWDKNHPRVIRLRSYLKSEDFMHNPLKLTDRMNAEEYCNLCITLISQATYMLDRLLVKQQENFVITGGIREQMTKARINYRNSQNNQTNQGTRTYQTYQTNRTAWTSPKSDTSDKSDKSNKIN